MKKKPPFTIEEHQKLAKLIRVTSDEFGKYVEIFYQTYGVNSKETKILLKMLKLMTSNLCNEMDNHFYMLKTLNGEITSPYYAHGISHY